MLCFIMFCVSLGVFGIEMWYLSDLKGNNSIQNTFKYDVIAYPMTLVLTIFELVSCIYFIWNYFLWCQSLSKSAGKRRKFNFVVVIFGLVIIVLITIDTLLKLIGTFSCLPSYIQNWTGTPSLVVGTSRWVTYFMKPYILLGASLIGGVFFLSAFILQKQWFKSEIDENSLQSVQNHYRNLEMNKKRSLIKKQKQKDLSKKIKVF